MVRPRINQFADDLGVTRSQAIKLINEGRRRSDGGSQTVEKNMSKMKELPKSKKKMLERYENDRAPKNPGTLYDAMEQADLDADVDADVEKRGMGGMCRGGGAAIQGTKFRGVS
jgi:hypothetical protein|tara:strand:+ start:72 stop:413 length:342 start_codon:yes stop_codon:yes gene_type:complete